MDAVYLQNISRIRAVAQALKPLNQKVVFVGGATIALYGNWNTAFEVRPTDDIDVVIELATYGSFAKLEERLREIGFVNDTEAKVVCRYKIRGITVDIMPTDPKVIGFSNRWYPEGFRSAIQYDLTERESIYIFSLEYLVATKLEAFFSRGKTDFLFSRDFEDLVYLFENAEGVEEALANCTGDLKNYLASSFKLLLQHEDFEEGLFAHLHPTHASFQVKRIKDLLLALIEKKNP
ncbi:MAG: nucleotidyl transferase AbiEii/AbiGii toxin family protein [Flavisolibacter sp.]|nr:nucleotidyl transferase AbiEii/AbiGii toxin family protein [Flavisolibacter sp.]